MDVQATCEVTHDFTGAMAVSIFFLAIFVGLLLADGVLTWIALTRAMQRDLVAEAERRETIDGLEKKIEKRRNELAGLNGMILQCAVPVDTAKSFRSELSSSSIHVAQQR
jgi:hypothetical protein